jgi:hypothetical protein
MKPIGISQTRLNHRFAPIRTLGAMPKAVGMEPAQVLVSTTSSPVVSVVRSLRTASGETRSFDVAGVDAFLSERLATIDSFDALRVPAISEPVVTYARTESMPPDFGYVVTHAGNTGCSVRLTLRIDPNSAETLSGGRRIPLAELEVECSTILTRPGLLEWSDPSAAPAAFGATSPYCQRL